MKARPLRFAPFVAAALLVALPLVAAAKAPPRKAKKPKAEVTIKVGTLAPTGSTFDKILTSMATEWERASEGKVAVTIFRDGSRGGESQMVRDMRLGALDGGMLTVNGLSDIDKSVQALQSMPMMFRSYEEVDAVGAHLQPRLASTLREKGFVVLYWADVGWVHFFSTKPILRPADLKKAKIFTLAGDPAAFDIYKKSGYHPVALETNDIHPSLLSGMIDTAVLPPVWANALQISPKPAGHMLDLKYAPVAGAVVIREKTWNKLDPGLRKTLAAIAAKAGQRMQAENHAAADAAIAAMVKRGLTVHKVTPELEAEWIREIEKVYPQIRGSIVPAPLFNEVQTLLQERRKAASAASETKSPASGAADPASAQTPASKAKAASATKSSVTKKN